MTGPVRRTLAAFASLVFATLGLAVVATPAHAADPPTLLPCVDAGAATYKHTFVAASGVSTATATIETTPSGTPICGSGQKFSLVSYFAPSVAFNANQYVFDDDVKTMSGTTTKLEFSVQVPPCYTQVDFVFGPVITDLRVQLYGDRKMGSGSGIGSHSPGQEPGSTATAATTGHVRTRARCRCLSATAPGRSS